MCVPYVLPLSTPCGVDCSVHLISVIFALLIDEFLLCVNYELPPRFPLQESPTTAAPPKKLIVVAGKMGRSYKEGGAAVHASCHCRGTIAAVGVIVNCLY